jgi:hypothetical protein
VPQVRVDLHSTLRPKLPELSAAIHKGLVEGLGMTPDDLFQIFRVHEPGELFYTLTFPDAERDDIVYIEILASRGYSDEQKAAGMRAVAEEVARTGIKIDDLLLVVTETGSSDWYAPGKAS